MHKLASGLAFPQIVFITRVARTLRALYATATESKAMTFDSTCEWFHRRILARWDEGIKADI